MNIEEAKDRCKNLVEYGLCYSLENTDLIAIDIVLKELDRYRELYHSEKEKIDRLQKDNDFLKQLYLGTEEFIRENYVEKDKIKNKIKELEEIIDNLSDKMIKAMERKRLVEFDEYNEMCKKHSFVLEILKELLEGE